MSPYVCANKVLSDEDYWRKQVAWDKNRAFTRYRINADEIYNPADITSEIYNELTYGLFWCYWYDFEIIGANMLVMSSNNYFVLTTRVKREKGKPITVWTNHGSYMDSDKKFVIYSPIPPRNRDKDTEGIGRVVSPALTGYKRSIRDMAVLMAYGVGTQEAFDVAFRGVPGNIKNVNNYTLAEVIKRPDLVEELKVELREAFEAKGITPDWLVDQLKGIAENQDHKQQFDTLMMMGRILGIGLDVYAKPESRAPEGSNLLMGYAARSIGSGAASDQVEEAVVVGPPESVRAALQGNE